jgi:hypothetical protein
MKKATFLLLIVFVLGGVYLSRSAGSALTTAPEPAPTATGGVAGEGERGAPSGESQPKTLEPANETRDSQQAPDETQKRNLQTQLQGLKIKAAALLPGGTRTAERTKLITDLNDLEKLLNGVGPDNKRALDSIQTKLNGLQMTQERLSRPAGDPTPDVEAVNKRKNDLFGKIAELEKNANSLRQTEPKSEEKNKLANDIGQLRLDVEKADPADLKNLSDLEKKYNENSQSYQRLKNEQSPSSSWLEWIIYGLVGLVILGGIGTLGYFWWKSRQHEEFAQLGKFEGLKAGHRDLSRKIGEIEKVVTNLSQQAAQQKSEISLLKQNLANRAVNASAPAAFSPPVQREQPRFPVSVEDYVARSGQNQPVRFDYKESMLVPDAEGTGGMLLVRDDGQLFLVPSFKFFQTGNDYSTYLSEYFDCARPVAGTVWIRQPATVTAQDGGWQIAQKGDIEVR